MKITLKSTIMAASILGALNTTMYTHAMDTIHITDRQEIIERFGQGNFTLPVLNSSIQRVVVQFGDPGFDGGDIFENIAAFSMEKDAISLTLITHAHRKDTNTYIPY